MVSRMLSMVEHSETLLEFIEPPDVVARRALGKDALLDGFQLDLEGVDDREVAIDHRVHQSVEHEAGAVAQQLRLALAAFADLHESVRAAAADRHEVVGADEHIDLADAERQLVLRIGLQQVHDGEEGVVVLLHLGPLVPMPRVLDREGVETERALHLQKLFLRCVMQCYPHEAIGQRQVVADAGHGNVGKLVAVLINDAIDQHADHPGEDEAGHLATGGTPVRRVFRAGSCRRR